METDYLLMGEQLRALIHKVPHRTANLANASALLFDSLERINWAGFYLLEDGKLVLNAFQGKPACIEISVGNGVCGTAVSKDQTLRIEDVHQFPGHIACDAASNSEIVIPIHSGKQIVGVLDIDSPFTSRFTKRDEEGLLQFVRILEEEMFHDQ